MVKYYIDEENRMIKCYLIDRNMNMVSTGIALCHMEDTWDVEFGKKLAYKRARIDEIGKNIGMYYDDLKYLEGHYNNIKNQILRKIAKQHKAIEFIKYS